MNAPQTSTWLVRPRPLPAPGLRLFCLAHSGGGAALFHGWSDGLPDNVELCAVQLPGRGIRFRERPYTRLEPLVAEMEEALQPFLDVPFALFGHSLGALLAFELARLLRRAGKEAQHLFVSACPAPQLLPAGPPLHALPEDEFLAALRGLNGTPPELFAEKELLALLLPVLRADMAVYETYEYREAAPLASPLTALGGRQDPRLSPAQLEAWREQTAKSFQLRLWDGDHFYLHQARGELLQMISGALSL